MFQPKTQKLQKKERYAIAMLFQMSNMLPLHTGVCSIVLWSFLEANENLLSSDMWCLGYIDPFVKSLFCASSSNSQL
uniref:Uncharacterized protein n=1 Tax=Rhizophora mucronata TaxID=61149 RepID=A0A2P2J094_RHIMU